jgi:hypothetical protein
MRIMECGSFFQGVQGKLFIATTTVNADEVLILVKT